MPRVPRALCAVQGSETPGGARSAPCTGEQQMPKPCLSVSGSFVRWRMTRSARCPSRTLGHHTVRTVYYDIPLLIRNSCVCPTGSDRVCGISQQKKKISGPADPRRKVRGRRALGARRAGAERRPGSRRQAKNLAHGGRGAHFITRRVFRFFVADSACLQRDPHNLETLAT